MLVKYTKIHTQTQKKINMFIYHTYARIDILEHLPYIYINKINE